MWVEAVNIGHGLEEKVKLACRNTLSFSDSSAWLSALSSVLDPRPSKTISIPASQSAMFLARWNACSWNSRFSCVKNLHAISTCYLGTG